MRREARPASGGVTTAALAAALLAACASAPREPVGERLDESTGATFTVIDRPIELLATRARGRDTDPFAYLAPFEINRMGARSQYLWVSVPGAGVRSPPRVLADGEPLEMSASALDLKAVGLSRPPYDSPAPWNAQFYYALGAGALARLAGAQELALAVSYDDTGIERYVTSGGPDPHLAEFAAGRAATD